MGPAEHPYPGGVDHAVDQVERLKAFRASHPEIAIDDPVAVSDRCWHARWETDIPPAHPGGEGVIELASHPHLRFLLDYLEARFE